MLYPVRSCCIAALAFGLVGCSMHPLPENFPLNFPRASTFDIVQKVRCEVQAGLERFKDSRRVDHVRRIVQATSIGYDFKFVMTETDNATDGELDFTRKSGKAGSKGNLTVDLSGKAAKTRSNTRTFRIVEDLAAVASADCSDEALRANLAYPISGRLRADDIVSTYIRLEMISNLDERGQDVAEVPVTDDPRDRTKVFSDLLVFNTRLSLGATPTLKVSAVAGSFRLTNATINGAAIRNDQHTLIVAFAQDPKFHETESGRAREQRRSLVLKREPDREGGQRSFLARGRQATQLTESVPLSVISEPRTQTTLVAANAVARNKVLLELARVRNLVDDEEETPRFLGERLLTFLRPPEETGPGERP